MGIGKQRLPRNCFWLSTQWAASRHFGKTAAFERHFHRRLFSEETRFLTLFLLENLQGNKSRGVHPLRQWCIFPLFQNSPLFPKNFSDPVQNFPDLTFVTKKIRFSSAKISDDLFLVITHKLLPLFSFFQSIPPILENFSFPTFQNFPPDFLKCPCSVHAFCDFRFSPYFDHDAFMHHTMHVLYASKQKRLNTQGHTEALTWILNDYSLSILFTSGLRRIYLTRLFCEVCLGIYTLYWI